MIELRCTDLDAAIADHEARGFRVDMIMPADDPEIVELSLGDACVRLVRTSPPRGVDGDWHVGRAGMEYRDLVPDRLDGRLIVSHIRIRDGGPVPDYVHYHAIDFQLIYVRAGWVRVVYEAQGAPFVMRAGDCVVQPPLIRHRVLEASAGLEVIELASPARHATYVDHDLVLPMPDLDPDREFRGQRFSWHRGSGLAVEDLGVAAATQGLVTARIIRNGAVAAGALAFPLDEREVLEVVLPAATP
jgi:quercetin dioxygenase-like cupin family protein